MPVDFYYLPISAPCRKALLTAKALGVELNLKIVNVLKGDQMKPEFLAINPEHCIPTIVDGDFALWESRAICTYLVSQYGKDDSFYPTDVRVRAKIDHLMYFDLGTLNTRFGDYWKPVLFGGQNKMDAGQLEKVQEALGYLNEAMQGHQWAVGNTITVADHVLAATVATMDAVGVDFSNHPNVASWYERCKSSMPGFVEINETPAKDFGKMVKAKLE